MWLLLSMDLLLSILQIASLLQDFWNIYWILTSISPMQFSSQLTNVLLVWLWFYDANINAPGNDFRLFNSFHTEKLIQKTLDPNPNWVCKMKATLLGLITNSRSWEEKFSWELWGGELKSLYKNEIALLPWSPSAL